MGDPFKMHDERHGFIQRKLAHPAEDEFLRIAVQVPFGKRGGIHGVEQLPDFAQVQFYFVRQVFGFPGHGYWLIEPRIWLKSHAWRG